MYASASSDVLSLPAETKARDLAILHCMRAPVGGLFRHVLDLAGEQADRGHRVGIVVDDNTSDALTQSKLDAIAPKLKLGLHSVAMVRQPGLGDLSAIASVTRIARALQPDVLHGHGAKGGAYARLAAPILGLMGKRPGVFYTPHGGSLHYRPGSLAGRTFLTIEKLMTLTTTGLIFESDYARRAFQAQIGSGQVPVRVVPNGIRRDDLVPSVAAPEARDFVFVGELRDVKGVDVLLRALAELNRSHTVTAVVVGSGPHAEALKALASELGLDDRVTFPGAMPARKAFVMGRCLVVPSLAESFPYVVLEAGAAGLPVIATDVGGIPEMVVGTSNLLIKAGHVEQLVAAMDSVLKDPATAERRACELRDVIAEKFTVGSMTDGVLDFYRSGLASVAASNMATL